MELFLQFRHFGLYTFLSCSGRYYTLKSVQTDKGAPDRRLPDDKGGRTLQCQPHPCGSLSSEVSLMTWASPWMTSVKAEPPYTDVDKLGQTTLLLHLHSTTATLLGNSTRLFSV